MVHIDVTLDVVTVEALDLAESFDGLAIFATAGSDIGTEKVIYKAVNSAAWETIPASTGAYGPGNLVLRERYIYEPGEYHLVSATRQRKEMRIFHLILESGKIHILPTSTPATWIIGNNDPIKPESSKVSIHIANGQIVSVNIGGEYTQERPTAWEHLENDGL